MNRFLPQIQIPEGCIHLGVGQPSNEMLPQRQLEQAAAEALAGTDPFFLAYGVEKGNMDFRQNLCRFLERQLPGRVDPDELVVTNGNSMGLHLMSTLFAKPGDTLFVEEPSYFLALKIFRDHGLNMVPIPMDREGVKTDVLEEKLSLHKPAFFYTIPVFHNPASTTLSGQRRKALIKIAIKHDLLLVADEVYQFLNYGDPVPFSLASYRHECRLVSLGSFSKILAPGLRLGWIHTRTELADRLASSGLLDSGGGMNPFTSRIVNRLLENGGLDQYIQALKTVYGKRSSTLFKSLEQYLPKDVEFEQPEGGYFIWLKLPHGMNAKSLRQQALSLGVDYNAGNLFSCRAGLENYIRLSFSFYDEPDLVEGVKRLSRLF